LNPRKIIMISSTIKKLALATKLYRPARWLRRMLSLKMRTEHICDINFYQSLIPNGSLCFDIGANIGEKSEALLKAGNRVVSFEPHPELHSELLARCGHFSNWTMVAAALGSKSAVSTLYCHQSHGSSSLIAEWQGGGNKSYDVPVVTLDAAIEHFGTPIYCKIDVEGWEPQVLEGLSHSIEMLSFEFHLNKRGIEQTMECLKHLRELGADQVNLTPAETSKFHLKKWVPIDEFISWFPGDLTDTLPGWPYGDIYVKSIPM